MKNYDFLLADADDTLLDFKRAEHDAITDLFISYGVVPDNSLLEAYSVHNNKLWRMHERSEITLDQLISTRFTTFFRDHSIKGDGIAAADLFIGLLSRYAYKIDGTDELFDRCRGKIKIYIISNGKTEVQLSRFALSGIDKAVHGIFLSEQIGYKKPDPGFFDAVASEIPGFDKGRALVYGDSLTADISGGVNYGIDTCWFNPGHKTNGSGVTPKYEVFSHAGIFPILNI